MTFYNVLFMRSMLLKNVSLFATMFQRGFEKGSPMKYSTSRSGTGITQDKMLVDPLNKMVDPNVLVKTTGLEVSKETNGWIERHCVNVVYLILFVLLFLLMFRFNWAFPPIGIEIPDTSTDSQVPPAKGAEGVLVFISKIFTAFKKMLGSLGTIATSISSWIPGLSTVISLLQGAYNSIFPWVYKSINYLVLKGLTGIKLFGNWWINTGWPELMDFWSWLKQEGYSRYLLFVIPAIYWLFSTFTSWAQAAGTHTAAATQLIFNALWPKVKTLVHWLYNQALYVPYYLVR